MRVVAYSIRVNEKLCIAVANKKKHAITLVSNPLTEITAEFAQGKHAVVVCSSDMVTEIVVSKLAGLGVKYIVTRSAETLHIDLEATKRFCIRVESVSKPLLTLDEDEVAKILALEVISHLDKWQQDELALQTLQIFRA